MTYQDSSLQSGAGHRDANVRETHDLIGSDKVEGTHVYGKENKHIGSIERVVLEKRSGRVAYAVLAFGGFLGFGEDHYPVPWSKLTYDENLGGYRTDLTEDVVKNAPHYSSDADYDWNQEQGRKVYDYYGIPPYWM